MRLWSATKTSTMDLASAAPPQIRSGISASVAWIVLGAFVLCLAGSASAIAQDRTDSPVGTWRTFGDDGDRPRGLVRISERDGELTGTVIGTLVAGEDINRPCIKCPGPRKNQPFLGLVFLTGLKKQGTDYGGGEILDPETGEVYRARLRLDPGGQRLSVRGYVGVSLFGRSQTWERVK